MPTSSMPNRKKEMKSSAGMTAQWFHDSPSAWREMWGDVGRCGEMWGDVGRYGGDSACGSGTERSSERASD